MAAVREAASGRSSVKLREYRRKRDFALTPEPSGATAADGAGNSFVVQKHDATRLHYDFRLELDGVLLSWAVPKGPSLDPAEKRLAMRTEDHPVDYGSFEGVIPDGEYGGGTVLLWDRGTWEAVGDPRKGLATGKLEFVLHGTKLRDAGPWCRSADASAGTPEGLAPHQGTGRHRTHIGGLRYHGGSPEERRDRARAGADLARA